MEKVTEIFASVRKEKRRCLLEPEAKTVCLEYSIPVTKFKVAESEDDAAEIAEGIGFPVVLKIVSPDVIHKTDAGGVVLNLNNARDVKRAYRTILAKVDDYDSEARILGVLVQEMIPSSTEVIVGAVKDNQFGPSVMFGLGGIFVEVLEDVAFRIAPITKQEAESMITEIKAYPVLRGYRNQPPLDTAAIVDIIVNTSKLVIEHREIKELDLNPVMVYERGAKAVDARIILD